MTTETRRASEWVRELEIVDCHAEGEIGRVITGGVGEVPGESMFEKKLWLERNDDELRRFTLLEPRGASWVNANIVLPSNHPDAAMGYIIMESTEYPAMSGSNTMCVATVLLEQGLVPMVEPVTELTLESPAGLITVRCECRGGKVTSVRFVNQPAFNYYRDTMIEVAGLGAVRVDVSWGGMGYVMVEAEELGLTIEPGAARDLVELGERIKMAAAEQLPVSFPGNPEMPGITNMEFMGPLTRTSEGILTAKYTVVVSPGRCDRSPCGTGSSARLALMHARGDLAVGEQFVHESITGSKFVCVRSSGRRGWVSTRRWCRRLRGRRGCKGSRVRCCRRRIRILRGMRCRIRGWTCQTSKCRNGSGSRRRAKP